MLKARKEEKRKGQKETKDRGNKGKNTGRAVVGTNATVPITASVIDGLAVPERQVWYYNTEFKKSHLVLCCPEETHFKYEGGDR